MWRVPWYRQMRGLSWERLIINETKNNMKIMNHKLLITIAAFSLGLSLNAQTIYHYKCVARVDPSTGVKEQCNGGLLHLIYEGNNVIWEVTEDGEKKPVSRFKNSTTNSNYLYASTEYQNLGEDYMRYTYQSQNDGIRVYRCIDEYKITMKYMSPEMTMSGIVYKNKEMNISSQRIVNYIYTSSDRRKINKCMEYKDETSKIFIFELYDTDEKGYSRPQHKNDPSKPTTLY